MPARKKSLALADAIASQIAEDGAKDTPAPMPKKRAYAASREGLLQDLGDGRLQNGKIRLVDPGRCRMWAGHNRLYHLLSPKSCGTLIDSIKALGRQETPAIVRPVSGDPDYDYEVICGARRHFAVSHLREVEHRTDLRYLVDVREVSDEEAFRISDAENRDREDISDYERAADYARALSLYYDGNKALMAERIGVDRTWLSRFVRIAALPEEVVSAYGDARRLGIRHASELFPLLSKPGQRTRVVDEAMRIALEQNGRSHTGRTLIEPRAVLCRLKEAAEGKRDERVVARRDTAGRALFRLEHRARSVVVTIPRERLAALEEVLGSLKDELS
ncbi:ParB/RepB/Spo0J family partition protein [Parvularcula dongshanensis]|uniref:ParB family chromosome partitioning protein n=1 Tax=Parvularcula dongshanensis TaxID=1173995 RepID=A0A840I3Z5_9PROT|nr:ParB/RepB/Spo0J family partition protein [Parvularcula dongshanensis]MBB4659055.1 ParB family chromosome partitioning protein [Parvularcula dongshanensis]